MNNTDCCSWDGVSFDLKMGNSFTGELPDLMGNLNHLTSLQLDTNKLSGSFPHVLFNFSELTQIDLVHNKFKGFCDADWAGCLDDRKSTSGGCFFLGNNMISWHIKKQKCVSLSTAETEYIAIGSCCTQLLWMKQMIADYGLIPPSRTNLTNLKSLDLSQNRKSGEIPPELGKLTFLARMNFSYNRLEGPIPQGTHIQSQNSSSFAENLGLFGAPLQETCSGGEEEATKQGQDEEKEEKEQALSWIAAAIAYVPGLVCGITIGYIFTS